MQAQKLKFFIQTELQLTQEQIDVIAVLVNAESVELITAAQKQKGWGSIVVNEKTTVFADLQGKIDIAGELNKLKKEKETLINVKTKL